MSCQLQAKYSFTVWVITTSEYPQSIVLRTPTGSFWRPTPWSPYKTVKCHPERQRRIYYRSEEDGKISFKVIDSSLCVTIPFPVLFTKHSYPRSEWRFWESTSLIMGNGKCHNEGNVNRHPERMWRIYYRSEESRYEDKSHQLWAVSCKLNILLRFESLRRASILSRTACASSLWIRSPAAFHFPF